MSRKHKCRRIQQPEKQATLKEYSVQATPLILRDLGWEFVTELAEAVWPKFVPADFRPLIFGRDGTTTVADAQGTDFPVKVFFAALSEFTDVPNDRALMIVPYTDKEGIKVLYFKWADETFYDSFSVPDGQNRIWDNKEKR